ncbi:hypothetical protein QYF36_025797 [Acer negundo]|nr:hypothetical protein QYF36_025797 [Acer negundo]
MQNGALDVILQQWQRIISLLHNWFDGCGDTAEDADRLFPKCLHSTLSLSERPKMVVGDGDGQTTYALSDGKHTKTY